MAVTYQKVIIHTIDGGGNTVIYTPYTDVQQVEGAVASINGVTPDENGNIVFELGDPSVGSLPLGFTFFSIAPTLDAGMIEDIGQEVSRTVYANLWEWVKAQDGLLITEEDWQTKYAEDPNNVPYYSNGDNATTFRMPCLRAYVVIVGKKGATNEIKGRYCTVAFSNVTNAGNLDVASILTALNQLTKRVSDNEAAIAKYQFKPQGTTRERAANKPTYVI